MTLARIRDTKQPGETKDWYIDLSKWFSTRSDLPASVDLVQPSGALFTASLLGSSGMMLRLTMSGGSDGLTYNAQAFVNTDSTPPVRREVDVTVLVRESQ